MLRIILTIVLTGLLTSYLFSQSKKRPPKPKSPFNAGITIGFNSSQIDGDYQSGFDKLGFSGGLQSWIYLNPSVDLSIDLLFSQRGSKPGNSMNSEAIDLNLNYAEVNVLLNFLVARSADLLPQIHLQAGVSFARLLNHRLKVFRFARNYIHPPNYPTIPEKSSFTEIANFFKANDFAVTGGVAFHIGPQFTFSPRFNYSLSLLFDSKSIPERKDLSMRSYFISIHGTYLILNPYKKKR